MTNDVVIQIAQLLAVDFRPRGTTPPQLFLGLHEFAAWWFLPEHPQIERRRGRADKAMRVMETPPSSPYGSEPFVRVLHDAVLPIDSAVMVTVGASVLVVGCAEMLR